MNRFNRYSNNVLAIFGLCLAIAFGSICLAPMRAQAGEYGAKVSITGGSPRQLAASLTAAGYAGRNQLDELTICNPISNAASVYRGQSDVSASNGFELPPGVCKTWRLANPQRPIDITRIYLFTASTQSVAIDLHSAD